MSSVVMMLCTTNYKTTFFLAFFLFLCFCSTGLIEEGFKLSRKKEKKEQTEERRTNKNDFRLTRPFQKALFFRFLCSRRYLEPGTKRRFEDSRLERSTNSRLTHLTNTNWRQTERQTKLNFGNCVTQQGMLFKEGLFFFGSQCRSTMTECEHDNNQRDNPSGHFTQCRPLEKRNKNQW